MQYDNNREVAKISPGSSGTSDQRRVIEQANFTYFLLGKALEKQIKTNEDQVIK